MSCISCCIRCSSGGLQPTSSSAQNPFHLDNLLKAGVVSVQLGRDPQPELYCEHRHEGDGWHPYFGATPFLPLTNLNDVSLCKALEFLVKHRFVAVTYRVQDGRVVFRLYLLPYDLAGAKGSLRVRQETVLAPAKRFLRDILPRVDKSASSWEGEAGEGTPLLPHIQDPRTLAEIYSDLESPNPLPVPGLGNISQRLLNYEDLLDGLGLRSKLYRYQRRSVAAMLHHELDLQDIPDPLFIPVITVDGQTFYFQPGTMEVLQDRPQVAPCRGGILCEELGTGKTVMIISLILATLRQLPTPEESLVDDRPVMTPLSFRHFPSSDCETARERMSYKDKGKERECRVPTLVELLVDRSRTSPCEDVPDFTSEQGRAQTERIASIEDRFENLPLDELRRETIPFYFHYNGDPSNSDRDSRRKRSSEAPRRMYLSPATLVVVPPNLLGQWDREIIKHSEYPLRVLILRDRSDMPTVKALCSDYDIVLMTYTRFTQESKKTTASLHSFTPCKCLPVPGSRVPLCTCASTTVSPLLQIRWKRLVIDEGHVSASVSTDLAPCTKAMSIERRWIVTGTPTTNLLGLGLGGRTVIDDQGEESDAMEGIEEGAGHDTFLLNVPHPPAVLPYSTISRNLSTMSIDTPISSSTSSSRHGTPSSPSPRARVWDSDDRGDLRKLGNMITHFIAVPQFAADAKLMSTHVTDALVNGGAGGPRPGAIQVLNQVMGMVMVRHTVEDIEDDVVLPPLTHENVMLDLDPLAIKSYNALQASIVVNAVDSERKDQDYLFHPANADLLQVTIKNMSQIMFWSTDDKRYYVDQIYREGKVHMDRAIARNRPPEDIALLKDALRHIEIAATDTSWNLVHSHEDVPYRVYGLESNVYNAWTRIPGSSDPSLPPSFSGLLSADRLLRLYDLAVTKPLTTPDSIALLGEKVSAEDLRLRELYLESQEKKGRGRKGKGKERKLENVGNEVSGSHSQIIAATVKRASAKETMEEVRTELKESIAQLEEDLERQDLLGAVDSGDGDMSASESGSSGVTGASRVKVAVPPAPKAGAHAPKKLSVLAHNSVLAKVKIGSSASSKLNYIIAQVLQYSSKEKFLIFTDSELTLAHVAEAMDLIHVKYLRFSTQIPPRHREQLVLTFETSETYRVFLMELKHGARGLNLVSASRVIFCEPVWQADVESQAIKRVHRIGQTRPITVKTLAIRGTAEENMVARRNALRNSYDKLPKLIEEAGMRHFISNPKFIENPPTIVGIEFPLLDLPPVNLSQSVTLKIKKPKPERTTGPSPTKRRQVWLLDPMSGHDAEAPPPEPVTKRQRTIRFVV